MQENNLKEIVENILNREWAESEKIKLGYFEEYKTVDKNILYDSYKDDNEIIYVRKDMPEMINQGDTQAILRLDNEHIAKIPIIKFSTHNFLNYYPNIITESVKVWSELGFEVPEHKFYYLNINGKISISEEKQKKFDSPRVSISVDLGQNGKSIITYNEDKIKGLSNFKQIKEEFENGFAKIKNIEKEMIEDTNPNGGYGIMPHGHIDEYGSIDKAIRHMFLVQIDPEKNSGKLILGDIDHLFIYKH